MSGEHSDPGDNNSDLFSHSGYSENADQSTLRNISGSSTAEPSTSTPTDRSRAGTLARLQRILRSSQQQAEFPEGLESDRRNRLFPPDDTLVAGPSSSRRRYSYEQALSTIDTGSISESSYYSDANSSLSEYRNPSGSGPPS